VELNNNFVIELENLTKYYGKHRGIENLSLQIKKGTIYGFLGPNGAGKTTTIRCLLGILHPNSGNISVFGEKIDRWEVNIDLKERIGYLPGEFELYRHFTVKQILDYFESLRKRPAVLREKLITELDLDESRSVSQLSKGNKQKVGLVQALMHNPDLVILDEPTSGLDPLIQQRLYSILKELKKKERTIFFSSHNLSEVQKIADEVAIIKDGFLVSHDRIADLSLKVQQKLNITTKIPIPATICESTLINRYDQIYSMDGDHRYQIWLHRQNQNLSKVFGLLEEFEILDVALPESSVEEYFIQYYSENKEEYRDVDE
jgi:ABC-2 type transport system ATP-binding protein